MRLSCIERVEIGRQRLAVLALLVLLAEVLALSWLQLWRYAGEPGFFFNGDQDAYWEGSRRLVATGSPYSIELRRGPIDNKPENLGIGYLYPPPLAQFFSYVPAGSRAFIGTALSLAQLILFALLLPLVYIRRGGTRSIASVLFVWIATFSSFPLHFAAYGGNVSGWVALAVSVMLLGPGVRASFAAVLAALLKMTPAVLLVPALADSRTRSATVALLTVTIALSFALDPKAWIDWAALLPNILRFPPGPEDANLSITGVLSSTSMAPAAQPISVGVAIAALVVAVRCVAQHRWAASVAAATGALLLGPNMIWDHYLVVLLPLVIAAWPMSTRAHRSVLLAMILVSASMWIDWFGGGTRPAPARAVALFVVIATIVTSVHALRKRQPASSERDDERIVASTQSVW